MKQKILKYSEAHPLINEADILLFKHGGFPSVGWMIGKYSQSPYSHIGLASREGSEIVCLEFREFIGSRKYPLKQYIEENPRRIDVFRVCYKITIPEYDFGHVHDNNITFTHNKAKLITDYARTLIGKKYSWYLIFGMVASFIPFVRLKQKISFGNDEEETLSFVCSTLVNHTYRRYYTDLVKFLPDAYTKPGDIARSPIINYLFTLDI